MKLLRITAQGFGLFKNDLDITLYAQQRIEEDDKEQLFHLFSNVYLNCAEAFIGLNASGKTSVLKIILLALGILNGKMINYMETKDIIGDAERATLNIYFSSCSVELCWLKTVISSDKRKEEDSRYAIIEESLWAKPVSENMTRKSIIDFSKAALISERHQIDAYIPDDMSIIVTHNKTYKEGIKISSLLSFTNVNILPFTEDISPDIAAFFDPTIEQLYFHRNGIKTQVHLKFKGKDELILNSPSDLGIYLSSGTIKGIITFSMAKEVLESGGYLVIDEIENHFNKEIVATLIRFFMDMRLNKHGGTLIFTTHYPEILDEYDRNDSIYITRNKDGITADNLSTILRRNDIKKSEAYESGFLEGTVPVYEAYIKLKKSLSASL